MLRIYILAASLFTAIALGGCGGSVEIGASSTGAGGEGTASSTATTASSSTAVSSSSSTGTGGAPSACSALISCLPGVFADCGDSASPPLTVPCCQGSAAIAACAVAAGVLTHACGGADGGSCPSGLCALTLDGSVTTCCDVGAFGADGGSADPCNTPP